MFKTSLSGISLDAAGLIALADLSTVAHRTVLTGTASLLDVLVIVPGIHCQQEASEVNRGELPTTGAMTSGYVFRIENPATVAYLQRVGRTGYLVTVCVSQGPGPARNDALGRLRRFFRASESTAAAFYLVGPVLTIAALVVLASFQDWWALGVLCMLMLARLLNIVVIRRRSVVGWKGASEVGVEGDLLVLLSQDRWVRMRGLVDDLKAVTAGEWLRETDAVETFAANLGTLLVYVSAALAGNSSTAGSLVLACLLLISVAALGLCNSMTKTLQMFGRIVSVEGEPKKYERRLHLAQALVESSGRDDWAVGMGLIVPKQDAQRAIPLMAEPVGDTRPGVKDGAASRDEMKAVPSRSQDIIAEETKCTSLSDEIMNTPQSITQASNDSLSVPETSAVPETALMVLPLLDIQEDKLTPSARRERRKKLRKQVEGPAPVENRIELRDELNGRRRAPDIEVPGQRVFQGTEVISSSLASTPCTHLGVANMLIELNKILGSEYTLDVPGLKGLLESCISEVYDFGTAYGRLRPYWWTGLYGRRVRDEFTTLPDELARYELEDRERRERAVVNQQTVDPRVPPRRLWDLYSNRVVPSWLVRHVYWAVSHAWMDETLRVGVWTPVNAFEWPVPLPCDSTLDGVRIELLNLGVEYAWLDVLCLRQANGRAENLRVEEWKLDVPTIGTVYHQNQSIIYYFSGLGRAFRIEDLQGPRHWLNRAWTLQEISMDYIVAGQWSGGPKLDSDEDSEAERFRERFTASYGFAQEVENIFSVLASMRDRHAVNAIDKVAGCAYLLRSNTLPAYYATEDPEDAWTRLVECMQEQYRGDLFFLYPLPGEGHAKWRPSWNQILTTALPKIGGVYVAAQLKHHLEEGVAQYHGFCMDRCLLRGFAAANPTVSRRTGVVDVEDYNGEQLSLAVFAVHQHAIQDDHYTLVGGGGDEYWVVCRVVPASEKLEKVSVLRMVNHSRDLLNKHRVRLGRVRDIELI